MKPHIKVIQRNGFDIYVTSSMTMKATKAEIRMIRGMQGVQGAMGGDGGFMRYFASASSSNRYLPLGYDPRQTSGNY
jgi:hypothetical protein